ncbi:MAG: ComF family protein [Alphaproteobacteria bacterium]|nr:ComF family protein [Alphaproteobacteria bacterium]
MIALTGWRRAAVWGQRVTRVTVDLVLPPRCLACGVEVPSLGSLCLGCWADLRFISRPLCDLCGDPFETAPPGPSVCGDCLVAPTRYDRARSALRYDDGSRPLILGFKHGDRLHLAPTMAGWMRVAGAELLAEAEVLVPVPLHRWRLWARRYNQAALLAHGVARATGLPVADRCLLRVRRTPSQGRLTASQRARNVQGAFAVAPDRRAEIAGRRVLLIDDVLTSGATATACARTLRRAGAVAVDVLTLARVI